MFLPFPTSDDVCGLSHSPSTWRTRITPGLDYTMVQAGLTHRCQTSHHCSHQSHALPKPLTSCQSIFVPSPPTVATSCYLHGLVFLTLRTDQSSSHTFGKPPIAPRIFPVSHCFPALISIILSNTLCIHCVSILHWTTFVPDL